MREKIHYPSPNFESRPQGVPVDLIVLHYTDMSTAEEALVRLCDAQAKVSAHFLISKEGALYQLVDPAYRAWHAGISSWQGQEDINSRSIGIELDNRGHSGELEPFPAPQIETLLGLLEELTRLYGIPGHHIVGHSDVAPLRKKDPGELFPWQDLARKGFGLWPFLNLDEVSHLGLLSPLEIQKALAKIGYACPQTGILDEDTKTICRAFQRHFTPLEVTGYPSELTCKTLQALQEVVKPLVEVPLVERASER